MTNAKPPLPPTPPPPGDDPLTDRAKGFTKGIAYLIASTLGIFILIYGVSANMHRGKGLAYLFAAIICIRGIIKGFSYILQGNQKTLEEEARKAERASERDLIQKWGCLKLIFIIIVSLIVIFVWLLISSHTSSS